MELDDHAERLSLPHRVLGQEHFEVLEALKAGGWMTMKELAAATGLPEGSFRRRLPLLERVGCVVRMTHRWDSVATKWHVTEKGEWHVDERETVALLGDRVPPIEARA